MKDPLTKKQREAITLLRSDWSLSFIDGLSGFAMLQQGEPGHGGYGKRLNINTFRSLRDRGLIVAGEKKFPRTVYELTALGRVI